MSIKFNKKIRNLIADFRLLPREDSIAYLRRPKKIGKVVDVALTDMSIKRKYEHILLENWKEIIGEQFYRRCRPVTVLINDVLLIGCENSVIHYELEREKKLILEKISTLPKCTHIKDIRFNIANIVS